MEMELWVKTPTVRPTGDSVPNQRQIVTQGSKISRWSKEWDSVIWFGALDEKDMPLFL